MGEMRNAYTISVGRPEGNIPLGRPRHRWKDNIKMDLREIRFGGIDWIHLARDRDLVAGSYAHGNEPLGSKKDAEFLY
jgi:hypothetical protein